MSTVAVLGDDCAGLRPSVTVEAGARVRAGDVLLRDRRHPEITVTAPASGVVTAVHRGGRRRLLSVVVRLDGHAPAQRWPATPPHALARLTADDARTRLLEAGLWPALRTRPFEHVASPATRPAALFVTAIDTNPLAADPAAVLAAERDAFVAGLTVLARLVEAPVHLCLARDTPVPSGTPAEIAIARFAGPHPAGLVGTHIHLLAPASRRRTVWHVGYQDVVTIGHVLTSGRPWGERIVAIAGPVVRRPRLVRTRSGASTAELVQGELHDMPCRVVAGSPLAGHTAAGPLAFLGRHHTQVAVLPDAALASAPAPLTPRRAWSVHRPLCFPPRVREMTTALHGRPGPMIPVDTFERVLPLDLLPTPLLRALLVGDLEMAERLGCLELAEEDLALCSVVCPAKHDYGRLLRETLTELERQT